MKICFCLQTLIARRKAAAKRNKLKNLGKSKSTDTEDEDASEECTEDGNDYHVKSFMFFRQATQENTKIS